MKLTGLRVLNDTDIERIHAESLRILEKAGVRVMDGECRAALAAAGAKLDGGAERVYLPPALVEECRALAPAEFFLYGADGTPLRVATDSHCFGSLVIDPWIIDYDTQLPRRPRLDDVTLHARLGDAHPAVSFIYRMDMAVEDCPAQQAYIRTLEAVAANTTKPLMAAPASAETLRNWLDVAEILADGAAGPRLIMGSPVTTPLTFHPINAAIMKAGLRAGLPFNAQSEPIAGTTAPYSFAGGLLLGNAENLFLLTLAQVLKPGAAFAYSSGNALTDMATGRVLFYNADKMLWKTAIAQLAGFYRLPLEGEITGSLVGRYDTQNGMELALLMLPVLLGSGGMFCGLGSCYNACGFSAEMMVMDADLAALLQRISAGIDFSDYMLNTDSIIEQGPGGTFLAEPFTVEMLRSGEFFTGGCFDRLGEQGRNDPADSMLARAHERVLELSAKAPTVPARIVEALRRWAERTAGEAVPT